MPPPGGSSPGQQENPVDQLTAKSQAAAMRTAKDVVIRANIAWNNFGSWDDPKGIFSGSLTATILWQEEQSANPHFGDAYDMRGLLNVRNHLTGAPGRVDVGSMITSSNLDGAGGSVKSAARSFVGDFQQEVDGYCYPFDVQTVTAVVELIKPMSFYSEFLLTCRPFDGADSPCHLLGEDQNLTNTTLVNENVSSAPRLLNRAFEDKIKVGFRWTAFECRLQDESTRDTIICTMSGSRQVYKVMMKSFLPGLVMSIVSFASFLLPETMAMPRVATTMIALLTFVAMYRSVMSQVPARGSSWLEEFYCIGMIVMLFNMLGHIFAFYAQEKIKWTIDSEVTMHMIEFFVFCLALSCRLHVRECSRVSSLLTGSFIVVFSVLCCLALCVYMSVHRIIKARLRSSFTEYSIPEEAAPSAQAYGNGGPSPRPPAAEEGLRSAAAYAGGPGPRSDLKEDNAVA